MAIKNAANGAPPIADGVTAVMKSHVSCARTPAAEPVSAPFET